MTLNKVLGSRLWLALAPALYVVMAYIICEPLNSRVRFLDPDFVYLMNGFSVAAGGFPAFIDHPGIALQLLEGALVWLKASFFPESAAPNLLADELLLHASYYHRYLNTVFLATNTAAIFLLGWVFKKRGRPLIDCLICQLAVLDVVFYSQNIYRVIPETVMITLIVALGLLMTASSWWKFLYPLVAGAACAVKFYLFPFLLGGFAFGVRFGILSFFSGIGVFVFFLTFNPGWKRLLGYFSSFFYHTGYVASGKAGILDLPMLRFQMGKLRDESSWPLFAISLLLSLAFLATWARARNFDEAPRRALVVTALFIMSILGFVKHPYQPHYVMPILLLFPFIYVSMISFFSGGWRTLIRSSAAICVIACLAHRVFITAQFNTNHILNFSHDGRIISEVFAAKPDCVRILEDTVPVEAIGLWHGNVAAGEYWSADLRRLYPDHYVITDEGRVAGFGKMHGNVRDFFKSIRDRCVVVVAVEGNSVIYVKFGDLFERSELLYLSDAAKIVYLPKTAR